MPSTPMLRAWLSELAERHRVGQRMAAERIAQGRELLAGLEAQAITPDDRARLSELRSALDAAPTISPHENPAAGLSARYRRNKHEPQGGDREFGPRDLLRADLVRFVHRLGESGASRGLRLARLSLTVPEHLGGDVLTVRSLGELFVERVSHGGPFDGAMLVLDYGKRGGAWHFYGVAVTRMADDELRSAWLRISGAGHESQLVGELQASARDWSPMNRKLIANLLRVIDYATKPLPAEAEPHALHERIIAAGSLDWIATMPDCGSVPIARAYLRRTAVVSPPAHECEPLHPEHTTGVVTPAYRQPAHSAVTRERSNPMHPEHRCCAVCDNPLPPGGRADQRYCKVRCRVRAHRAGNLIPTPAESPEMVTRVVRLTREHAARTAGLMSRLFATADGYTGTFRVKRFTLTECDAGGPDVHYEEPTLTVGPGTSERVGKTLAEIMEHLENGTTAVRWAA